MGTVLFIECLQKTLKLAIAALAFSISLSGCATVYNPATGQEELVFIDTNSEVLLGRNIDYKISKTRHVVKEPGINERVNAIGENIARVCDRKDLKYHFRVIKDKEVNAFSTPGGYVYVNTGLLDKVDDDEELASVLGHEVGHIAARHVVKKVQAQMGYNILMSLAFGRGGSRDIERAINITFDIVSLGYSREDELLADKLAIRYAYKAGYKPEAIVAFFKKLQELEKDKTFATPLFLRSHPYLEERIRHAKEGIATVSSAPSPLPAKPVYSQEFLSSQHGLYKVCPTCSNSYSRGYLYCPKDGAKLKY